MYVLYSLIALAAGFLLDIIIGDPHFVYHPVRLMGRLINLSEKVIRKFIPRTEKGLVNGGKLLVLSVCGITAACVFVILFGLYKINVTLGVASESIMCYFMLAAKSLRTESMKVYYELEKNNIEGARNAVSKIVGRDTENLGKEDIIKAAVESVAENTSDGVIAPMIYIALGGALLGAFYKAVNTMDSMVGYKNEKYLYFGKIPAKLDDILNYIPSRISAYVMILASFLLRLDWKNAHKIYMRDRNNHSSPNSAQTESVCAGALGIRLGGNAFYFGKLYRKENIGDDINKITYECIKLSNNLMYMTAFLSFLILCGIKLFVVLRFFL